MSKRKYEAVTASAHDGSSLFHDVIDIVKWLKGKYHNDGINSRKTLDDIIGYLSALPEDRAFRTRLAKALNDNSQITVIAKGKERNKTICYRYKTKLPIHDSESLLKFLSARPVGDTEMPMGVSVKDLKDGWMNCESHLFELESEHKLLLRRNPKGDPVMVFLDNPNLYINAASTPNGKVSEDFAEFWNATKLPTDTEIKEALEEAKMTVTTTEKKPDQRFFNRAGGGKGKKKKFDPKKSSNAKLFEIGVLKNYGPK